MVVAQCRTSESALRALIALSLRTFIITCVVGRVLRICSIPAKVILDVQSLAQSCTRSLSRSCEWTRYARETLVVVYRIDHVLSFPCDER